MGPPVNGVLQALDAAEPAMEAARGLVQQLQEEEQAHDAHLDSVISAHNACLAERSRMEDCLWQQGPDAVPSCERPMS